MGKLDDSGVGSGFPRPLSDDAPPPATGSGRAAPSPRHQQRTDVERQRAGGDCNIGPERPQRGPALDHRCPVTPPVAQPRLRARVEGHPIELHQDPLFVVPVVVMPPAAPRRLLGPAGWQPVSPLHVTDVAHLERALRARPDVDERLGEESAPAMAPPTRQGRQQCLVPGQPFLAGQRRQRDRLVGSASLGEVEHGVLDGGPRRMGVLVGASLQVAAPLDIDPVHPPHPAGVGDEDHDHGGGRLAQAEGEARGAL